MSDHRRPCASSPAALGESAIPREDNDPQSVRLPDRRFLVTDPTRPAEETKAMTKLVTILDGLDPAAQERVVRWLGERYRQPANQPDE